MKNDFVKILLVKLSSLGDVVHTLPVVADIRAALPNAQIDWVVEGAFAPLVARCQGVQRVIPCAFRRWRKSAWRLETLQAMRQFRAVLQAQAYDAVIDLQGLSKSALVACLAKLSPNGQRVAMAQATQGSSFESPSRWVAHRVVDVRKHPHAVARGRALCAQALAYAMPTSTPQFGLRTHSFGLSAQALAPQATRAFALAVKPASVLAPEVPSHPAANPAEAQAPPASVLPMGSFSAACREGFIPPQIALVHGTSKASKLWPLAHWQALGQGLLAAGFRLALPSGNAAEAQFSAQLAAALGPHAQVWPPMPIDRLADALATCQGVVGVDSGPTHLAAALGLAQVQIYNHPTAWRTGPVGCSKQCAVVALPGESFPSVEAVWAAWQSLGAFV